MSREKPTLAVFWGDTRELLSRQERMSLLSEAVLESITPAEVLLRDRSSGRIIVVTSVSEKNLFCSLCKTDVVRRKYGKSCPGFAKCLVHGRHRGNGDTDKTGT